MKNSILALVAVFALAPAAHAATLYNCPTSGTSTGWDNIDRGFYVTQYPGTTLDTVTLSYFAVTANGSYTIALTAHLGAYDGAVIGSTQQQTVMLNGNAATPVTFNFGNAVVPFGSTVAFTQSVVSGPGTAPQAGYDIGTTTPACPGIYETDDTAPPLGSPPIRGNTVGVTIAGASPLPPPPPPQAPVSAPTLGFSSLALMIAGLLGLASLFARARRENREG